MKIIYGILKEPLSESAYLLKGYKEKNSFYVMYVLETYIDLNETFSTFYVSNNKLMDNVFMQKVERIDTSNLLELFENLEEAKLYFLLNFKNL